VVADFCFRSEYEIAQRSALLFCKCVIGRAPLLRRPLLENELEQAFRFFDRDDNGNVCPTEFSTAVQNLGEHFTAAEMKAMHETIFRGEGICLSYDGMKASVRLVLDEACSTDVFSNLLDDTFEFFNKEGSDAIDFKEFLSTLKMISPNTLEEEKVQRILARMDTNNDQMISLQEWKTFMGGHGASAAEAGIFPSNSSSKIDCTPVEDLEAS